MISFLLLPQYNKFIFFFFTEAALNHCRWTDHQKPLEGKHPEHRGGHVNLVVNKHQQQQVLLACEFWPPCISAVQKNKLSQALETLYLLTRDKIQNLGLPRRKKCSLSPAPHLLNRAPNDAISWAPSMPSSFHLLSSHAEVCFYALLLLPLHPRGGGRRETTGGPCLVRRESVRRAGEANPTFVLQVVELSHGGNRQEGDAG